MKMRRSESTFHFSCNLLEQNELICIQRTIGSLTTKANRNQLKRIMDELDLRPAKEIAAILRTTSEQLRRWRKQGRGPAYVRMGSRQIFYDFRDVEDWLNQRKIFPTAV
jgi:Helix-turn-helix domain